MGEVVGRCNGAGVVTAVGSRRGIGLGGSQEGEDEGIGIEGAGGGDKVDVVWEAVW